MQQELTYSAAAERNREPILVALRPHMADCRHVLEIGSGTGQHAEHFAAVLRHLQWQCSDLPENLPGLRARLALAGLPNTPAPVALDVRDRPWPVAAIDALYSANTLHIMGWPEVEALFAGMQDVLEPRALVAIYGPFNIDGRFTSDSNAAFDAALRAADPRRGIRDLEAVDALAAGCGFRMIEDVALPANNRLVLWRRAAY
jgi:cyclopropane fatty-acyl-phospholipid synthase-like methyltransferase